MGNYENDRAFEAVLQNTGHNIEAFVDEFFSFLARRSDFFVVSPPEGGKLGFPPGIAAKLIISKFKKWDDYYKKDTNTMTVPPRVAAAMTDEVPAVGMTVEVKDSDPLELNQKTGVSRTDGNVENSEPRKNSELKTTTEKTESSKKSKSTATSNSSSVPTGFCDTYNGQKTDKYSWSQSITELDVHLAVDADVKTKKQVKVDILMDKIRVVVTGLNNETVSTDWQLAHAIVKDESYWSLHPGESIFLSLQKVREMWWDHLFEGEQLIDRTKIEAVRPMDELDDEEQAKLQELVWNQEQKLKGLPTSDEMKIEKVMRKAWDAEGSPFQGQPFDMSRIQMATNTITPTHPNS